MNNSELSLTLNRHINRYFEGIQSLPHPHEYPIPENQQQIEMGLKSRSSVNRRQARNQQMRNAVQEFAETSAVLLQER